MDYIKYIEDNTIRCEASYRGGGIEIGASELFPALDYDYAKISAYQNYLGGGMLGAIQSSSNFHPDDLNKTDREKFNKLVDGLKKYFHDLTNHGGDEWETATFEQNQNRPASAY